MEKLKLKRIIVFIIALISLTPASLFSQNNFEITVIDSFKWTDYSGIGVESADAVEFNGSVFLSYYYTPNASNKSYVFFTKKIGGAFSIDTVATIIRDGSLHHKETAIQIDSSGNPWVYYVYGGNIFASRKIDGEWVTDQIATDLFISSITTIEGGANTIGLFYKGTTTPAQTSTGLMFTQWKNNAWETKILYEKPYGWRDPSPSAVQVGNDIYVSFITISGSPDSVIVHVLKGNNGNWEQDFSDVVVGQVGGAYISDRGMLGKSENGNVLLWREYGRTDLGEGLGWRLFEKDINGWHRIQLQSPPNGFMGWPQGSNIVVTSNKTVVMVSESNGFGTKISWVKPDGSCGVNDKLPRWEWNPFSVWLQDIVTIGDNICIYYVNGAAYNYDYPVTFKEAKININDLVTGIEINENNLPTKFSLSQNYPNPFNPSTTINYSLPKSRNVTLKVFDILGQEVTTLVNEKQSAGKYEVKFDADNLSSGIYFYRLKANNLWKTKKMILLK